MRSNMRPERRCAKPSHASSKVRKCHFHEAPAAGGGDVPAKNDLSTLACRISRNLRQTSSASAQARSARHVCASRSASCGSLWRSTTPSRSAGSSSSLVSLRLEDGESPGTVARIFAGPGVVLVPSGVLSTPQALKIVWKILIVFCLLRAPRRSGRSRAGLRPRRLVDPCGGRGRLTRLGT